jgi:SPP1 gp7 family putative phage head morphogenesis protein
MNSSLFQAKRLVVTEQAYFTSEAQKKTFNELDVEEFEVVSSADMKVCNKCAAHDKTHYPMRDFAIGITAPPFHPLCRCVTAPFFDDEFTVGATRIVTDSDGETYRIPQNMSYKEWFERFVKEGKK